MAVTPCRLDCRRQNAIGCLRQCRKFILDETDKTRSRGFENYQIFDARLNSCLLSARGDLYCVPLAAASYKRMIVLLAVELHSLPGMLREINDDPRDLR